MDLNIGNMEDKDSKKQIEALKAECRKCFRRSNDLIDSYAKQFGKIMDMQLEFFVGDFRDFEEKSRRNPHIPLDIAYFGDCCFDLTDIRVVVDNFPHWLSRYKSREEVRDQVINWYDYACNNYGKDNYINLYSWLLGLDPQTLSESKTKNNVSNGTENQIQHQLEDNSGDV